MPFFRDLLPRTTRGRLAAVTLLLSAAAPVLPAAASSDSLAAQMQRLRQCESSNDYRTNTGNGYYGAYQFDQRTWSAMGYQNRPDRNAVSTQDKATIRLHSQRGWTPWPACARKEHLH